MHLPRNGIRFRIYSGTGILVALGLLLAGIAVAELSSIDREVAAMAVQQEANARFLEVERLLEITGRSALGYWLSGDAAMLRQGSDADAKAEALLRQAIDATRTDDDRRVFQAVVSGIEEFRRTRNVLVIMTDEVGGLRGELAQGGDAAVRQDERLAEAVAATGDAALTSAAWNVEKSVLQARSDAWRFFAGPDSQRQSAFKASAERAVEAINHLQDADLSDELQSLAAPVGSGLAAYISAFDQLSEEVLKQQELFDRQMRPQIDHLLDMVRGATEVQRRNLNGIKQMTEALIEKTIRIQKSLAGLGFIVGGLIALLVCRSIIRPLAGMTAAMGRLAAGDTAIEIPSRAATDEIGAMAKAVEVFRENAIVRADLEAAQVEQARCAAEQRRAALTNMAEAVEREASLALVEVGHRAAGMAATADAVAASAGRTGAVAKDTATAATQALATAQAVASAAEELAASVKEIGGQVSRSTVIVGHAVDAGRAARQSIETLNEQVARIGTIADMIAQVAGRTNLLALNATIEAARAGDAGKGFAVVASEVKQLAAQTARSTEEIGRQLNEVRAATGVSVTAVDRIEQTIDAINAIAGSIAAAVEEQGAATAEIARNTEGSAMVANDIARRIIDVSGEAEQTSRHAAEIRADTAVLNAAVGELGQSVIRTVRTCASDVEVAVT